MKKFWRHLDLSCFLPGSRPLIVGWANHLISLNSNVLIYKMRITIHMLLDGFKARGLHTFLPKARKEICLALWVM